MTIKLTGDVQTLYEASQLLKVSEKTLAKQAKAGRVPHFRIGKQFRFHRETLLEWARTGTVLQPTNSAELEVGNGN